MDEDAFVIVSSDGHAGAVMEDYRPYLDPEYRADFDDFLKLWKEEGYRTFERRSLERRIDPEFVDDWVAKMGDTGRLDGFSDPIRRLKEVEHEGIAAEVLFPDFGLPFELSGPSARALRNLPPLSLGHRQASYRAFNRWLADFTSVAPTRFAGMAVTTWEDVDEAIGQIRGAHEAGLKGVVLPAFSQDLPLYHPQFDPIWSTLEELDLVANSHAGISSTSDREIRTPDAPHPACAIRLWMAENTFFCHNILSHLIWGGVLERHPRLRIALTEQGTGWVTAALTGMDYVFEGSYFRSDYKEIIPLKPSEYFDRNCFMGASIFSRAEVEQRHELGIDKMMLGMDFPHHEGTLVESTREYLKATLGAAHVPLDEARKLLGENTAGLFGFDLDVLRPIAERIGPLPEEILIEPEDDLYARGDVHKPAMLHI